MLNIRNMNLSKLHLYWLVRRIFEIKNVAYHTCSSKINQNAALPCFSWVIQLHTIRSHYQVNKSTSQNGMDSLVSPYGKQFAIISSPNQQYHASLLTTATSHFIIVKESKLIPLNQYGILLLFEETRHRELTQSHNTRLLSEPQLRASLQLYNSRQNGLSPTYNHQLKLLHNTMPWPAHNCRHANLTYDVPNKVERLKVASCHPKPFNGHNVLATHPLSIQSISTKSMQY